MSLKESIGWTDKTCNPIKGKCKGGCWYCYTLPMYKMGRLSEPIRLELSAFDRLPKSPRKIFLCSTHELFGSWIPKDWRDKIFKRMEDFPQHTFQILTKMPENIDRPMPDNVHLGVSITGMGDQERMSYLHRIKAKIKFISWEPLFSNPLPPGWSIPKCVNWAIVGKLSGYGKKYDPQIEWIKAIVGFCQNAGIPVFLKNNLAKIWGPVLGPLIQEWPRD